MKNIFYTFLRMTHPKVNLNGYYCYATDFSYHNLVLLGYRPVNQSMKTHRGTGCIFYIKNNVFYASTTCSHHYHDELKTYKPLFEYQGRFVNNIKDLVFIKRNVSKEYRRDWELVPQEKIIPSCNYTLIHRKHLGFFQYISDVTGRERLIQDGEGAMAGYIDAYDFLNYYNPRSVYRIIPEFKGLYF